MSIALEGCACRKDSVIILEDAVIDDTGIERLFDKPVTPDPSGKEEPNV